MTDTPNLLKGQVAMAFVVLRDASVLPGSAEALAIEAEIMKRQPGFISTQLHRGIAGSCVFTTHLFKKVAVPGICVE